MVPNPAPMPTAMPAPNRTPTPLAGQYGDSFIEAPRPAAPPPPPPPPGLGGAAAAPVMPAAEPFAPRPQPVATPLPPAAPVAAPAAASGDAAALLDAICRGAGLPEGSLGAVDSLKLGEEIGKCLRIATEELMALLGARAAAKQFVKSASRTMIGGMNNSPLKFKPNAAEAMQTMFAQRSDSYLTSTASFQQGFDDIKRHQTAVYAAMQPALARLLEDLSPESIEERASGGLMSSKKANAWEIFVERWDAKTHPYENGMLDVFLAYFADAYDVAVKKTGG
jgi:type VI secretion system FHA domain protein